jgi:hypothetical protein
LVLIINIKSQIYREGKYCRIFLIFLLLFLELFKFCFGFCQILEKKTLSRSEDPVIVSAKYLKEMLNKKIKNLCLYSYRDGKFSPIPFQIDKKDENGNYIFSENKKDVLEPYDELVFEVKDTGDRISKENYGELEGLEIQIEDPLNFEKSWVYLLLFEKEPVKSEIDYVKYHEQEEKIETTNYIVGFSQDNPILIENLTIKKEGGGDGENKADRFKVRFRAKTYFGISIKTCEEDIESRITGIIDGPIRVIRRIKSVLNFYRIFRSPSGESLQIYYYNFFEFPVVLYFPFDVNEIFYKGCFRVTFESKEPTKRIFYNSNNKKGYFLDGVMSEEEKNLNLSPYKWCAVKEETGGAWITQLLLENQSLISPSLYYVDDKNIPDPPENFPGQIGNVGYEINNFEKIKKGFLRLKSIMYNLKNYSLGDEKKVLDILENPILIKVRKWI